MQAIPGIIFHFIGGFPSFSFYVPFKKAVSRAWESYLIIGGIFSWTIVLFILLYQAIPALMEMMGSFDSSAVFRTSFPAAFLGIVGLTFGLAARCQGISSGQYVSLAFCAAFGALMSFVYNINFIFSALAGTTWNKQFFCGMGESKSSSGASS